MAAHSSILAWRTSWTEEPGGSMGSHKESDTITTEQYICVCVYFLKLVFIYLFLAEPGLGSCE